MAVPKRPKSARMKERARADIRKVILTISIKLGFILFVPIIFLKVFNFKRLIKITLFLILLALEVFSKYSLEIHFSDIMLERCCNNKHLLKTTNPHIKTHE